MSNNIKPVSSFGLEKLASFDFKNITLSVILSNDGLSFFYIYQKKEFAFEKYNLNAKNIHEVIKSSAALSSEFSSVHIFFDNRYFTLLPSETATDGDKDAVSKMTFGESNLKNFFHRMKHFDVVFSVEMEFFNMIESQWKNAVYHHYAEALYNSIIPNVKNGEEVFFEIRKDFFWAILFNNTEMKIFNSYDFSGKADFGFFSLGIINNLGFNSKNLNLWISGNIEKDSPLENLLKGYIQNIQYFNSKNIVDKYVSFQHIINFLVSED